MKNRSLPLIAAAFGFSLLVPFLGYLYLGPLYALLFLVGYLGGFVLWIAAPPGASWRSIRLPYWLTLAAFVLLHKVEENRTAFFEAVSARVTGTPVPEVSLGLILALLVIPVGAWLAIPLLVRRDPEFGRFLAWTFFASMGLTELAHFIMPMLANEPYGYFPGMASVVVVAPLAWWGMSRLARGGTA
ncbi:hypothetical protein [Mesorhizobium sp. STM 4661]|uniref:hypothetical protein n=1 Tax=Mesorhizobium sp. STM 4661 TaxID=1297570 RepID=UPI0002BEC27B|nr:hypothetical protein [Mesorhizobium sp. STM 4661]CCV15087.1 conserved membrane hypothetical protein [Mesorhizobium sp. STM 4661]